MYVLDNEDSGVGGGGASVLVDLFLAAIIPVFRQTQSLRNYDKKKKHPAFLLPHYPFI